jgi:hypothetical protein
MYVGDRKIRNTGRSKDGALNKFHSGLFMLLLAALEETGREASIVPFLVSYEHVKDDVMVEGAQRIKSKIGGEASYAAELLYNVMSFGTFNREKPRAVLSFGERIPFSREAYQEDRGLLSYVGAKDALLETGGHLADLAMDYINKFRKEQPKTAEPPSRDRVGVHYAQKSRQEVGRLQVPFPSQVVSAATMRAMSKLIAKTEAPPRVAAAKMSQVDKYLQFIMGDLKQNGADLSYVTEDGIPLSLERLVSRAHSVLRDNLGRQLFSYDDDYIYVRKPDAFFQYGRHISHMLGKYRMPRWPIFRQFSR